MQQDLVRRSADDRFHHPAGHEAGDPYGDEAHVRIRAGGVSADLCFAEASPLIRTLGING